MSDILIVIIYVDDVLVYAYDSKDIDGLIKKLHKANIFICQEGTAEVYLGTMVERDGSKITLSRPALVKKDIEALGLCNKYFTAASTPDECAVLPRGLDGQPASGSINYPSVIGML